VEVIKWFEKNHPEDFDFYGVNWDGTHPAKKQSNIFSVIYPGVSLAFS
jgi:hypothetical protein